MSRQANKVQLLTVCRFGPGGEYRRDWPGDVGQGKFEAAGLFGQVGVVVGLLLRWVRGARGQAASKGELGCEIVDQALSGAVEASVHLNRARCGADASELRGKTASAAPRLSHCDPDARPDAGKESDPRCSGQQWLFADDGDSCRIAAGQRRHVRKRRSPRAKRSGADVAKQGMLFDD